MGLLAKIRAWLGIAATEIIKRCPEYGASLPHTARTVIQDQYTIAVGCRAATRELNNKAIRELLAQRRRSHRPH